MTFHHVSSEGGPIVVGDSDAILRWHGIAAGGSDYRLAGDVVETRPVVALSPNLIVWNFGGPGTAFIWHSSEALFAVRVWAGIDWEPSQCPQLLHQMVFAPPVASLAFPSGIAVFLWATEDGSTIGAFEGERGEPAGDFSMGGVAHFERTEERVCDICAAEGEIDGVQFTAIKIRRREPLQEATERNDE